MGRHALLEAPDAPLETPADPDSGLCSTVSPLTDVATPTGGRRHTRRREVLGADGERVAEATVVTSPESIRTVAEIIAAHRREIEASLAGADGVMLRHRAQTPGPWTDGGLSAGPWSTSTTAAAAPEAGDAAEEDADDRADDRQRDLQPTLGDTDPDAAPSPDTDHVSASAPDAAWEAALRPSGTRPATPRRRRAGTGSSASAVIASLTAELADSHPGLLDGTPHSRRAASSRKPAGPARAPKPTAPDGTRTATGRLLPALSQPAKVSGLRGAALRVPALAGGGWKLPARTPLVLAGAVAVSVVVTDQAGLLSAHAGTPEAAGATHTTDAAPAGKHAATTASAAAAAAAQAEAAGARVARSRVSRLERTPLSADGAAATPAGATTAVTAAPPPDSVMKPGQTIPGNWVRPSPTGVYNSCFCSRWGAFHEGIDFAAPLGSPVLAVGDGVVVEAGPASGFGNWVVIRHDNGDLTIYGHMKYFFVKAGQRVTAGQEIALVGKEGQSTGPHLHLGVMVGATSGTNGHYVDPVPWLVARGIDVGTYNVNG